MEIQRYVGIDQSFDSSCLEEIILRLGDTFDIRIAWDRDAAILTGVCAVAGGFIGSYVGGRLGAAVGASLSSAAGFGVATMVSLRELWNTIKDKLQELFYIVFNYLRTLDPIDIMHGFEILMACHGSRRELVYTIMDFIAVKLGTNVLFSLTAG